YRLPGGGGQGAHGHMAGYLGVRRGDLGSRGRPLLGLVPAAFPKAWAFPAPRHPPGPPRGRSAPPAGRRCCCVRRHVSPGGVLLRARRALHTAATASRPWWKP
ncbi:unnamed protein product, partial [Ectocarpus sp. 12 AP-2014]